MVQKDQAAGETLEAQSTEYWYPRTPGIAETRQLEATLRATTGELITTKLAGALVTAPAMLVTTTE